MKAQKVMKLVENCNQLFLFFQREADENEH